MKDRGTKKCNRKVERNGAYTSVETQSHTYTHTANKKFPERFNNRYECSENEKGIRGGKGLRN